MAGKLAAKDILIIFILFSGPFIGMFNSNLVAPAYPSIMVDFNISSTTVQWLSSIYALVEAVTIPLAAYLIGRFTTRRLFIFGMGSFLLGSILATLAPAFSILLVGRIFQSLGTGIMTPLSLTVILLVVPREKRGFTMGILSLIVCFAPAVGPAISGLIIDALGWHFVFGLISALAAVFFILAVVGLKNYGSFERTKFDLLSVILSTFGLLGLLYGLASVTTTEDPLVNGATIVAGIALLGLYVRRQLHLKHPMVKVTILKTQTYRRAICILMLIQGSLYGITPVIPIYIQNVLGQTASVSGLALMPGAILGAIFTLVAGGLFDRFGVRKIVLPGGAIMAIGGIGMFLLGADSQVIVAILALTAFQMGIQGCITPLNTWAINSLPDKVMQHAQSLQNTLIQVATAMGIAVLMALSATGTMVAPDATSLAQTMAGIHVSFTAVAVLVVAAFAFMVAMVKNKPLEKAGLSESEANLIASSRADQPLGARDAAVAGALAKEDGLAVRDVMNPNPAFVTAADSVRRALEIMADKDTSGVIVVGGNAEVEGFLSDGDIADFLGRSDRILFSVAVGSTLKDQQSLSEKIEDLSIMPASSIATSPAICADPDMPLDVALRMLADRQIKKMPVVDDGKLVGSISRRNAMRSLALALASSSKSRAEAASFNHREQ